MKTWMAILFSVGLASLAQPALWLLLFAGQAVAANSELKIPSQLESFRDAKKDEARSMAKSLHITVAPDIWNTFEALKRGDWETAFDLFEQLKRRCGQYAGSKDDPTVSTPVWQFLLETMLAYEQVVKGDRKYMTAFAVEVIQAIPPGSVYFGGTDPGRGLVTAFSPSHAKADPFFTITQNAMADTRYLEYLRWLYGGRLHLPSEQDSQNAFNDYAADVRKRRRHDRDFPTEPRQTKPTEDVRLVNGHVQLNGPVAVMAVNDWLTKVIFEKNPDRQFYVEESAPLDWMYPHLVPHGLIMKIHRQPLDAIPTETLQRNHEFWTKRTDQLLGSWLRENTSVAEVCAFVEKVFLRQDLTGFQGERRFVQDPCSSKLYSKLRSSQAGLYQWRSQRADQPAERNRMNLEADFAFRQALALCPSGIEAAVRYVHLLVGMGRIDDAMLVAQTAAKLEPDGRYSSVLAEDLRSLQKGQWPLKRFGWLVTLPRLPDSQTISNITLAAGPRSRASAALDADGFCHLLERSAPASPEMVDSLVKGLQLTHAALLDVNGFRQLVDLTARPSTDLVQSLQSAECYRGTFVQDERTYYFSLYLGGLGFMALPDGQRGFFYTPRPTISDRLRHGQ